MKLRTSLIGLAAALLFAGVASASTMRVVIVQATDVAGYTKALEDGKALMKTKGGSGQIRAWIATFAGENTGTVVVSIEYASFEALAKDFTLMRTDPEIKAWLQGLSRYRKVLSDSVYEELKH